MDINLLPDELWTEIFSKMTAKERKPVRIACRRWRNCCNRVQIQKMEKFHLPGVSHFEDMVKILLTNERWILNLKISNHRLETFDDAWWQWIYQVELLELENCIITDCLMEKILTCSDKLSHLTLRNVYIMTNFNRESPIFFSCLGTFFIKLNERNTIAASVKTLVIKCDNDNKPTLHLTELLSLVSVFPNVVNLELNLPHFVSTVLPGSVQEVDICETLVRHMATKLLQLETLNMKLPIPPPYCTCQKFLQEVNFSRLKTIKYYNMTLVYPPAETENYIPRLYSFITSSHSRNLTVVEFLDRAKARDIIDVLKNHIGLQKVNVKLTSVRDLFEFVNFFKALANSKLAYIRIEIQFKPEWIGSLHQILDDGSLRVNSTVRELVITCEHEEEIFISIFQKYFSALIRLKVYAFDKNSNLANIFSQLQANIKCVELRCKEVWNLGDDRKELLALKSTTSDKFVENLECLCIETGILKKMLLQEPSIFFSNLRYLYITNSRHGPMFSEQIPLTQGDLRCLPLHNLEAVFMCVHRCISDIFIFFSNPFDFPKIQFIGIRLLNADVVSHYQYWFQSWFEFCPCLKTIFIAYRNTGICLCYDPIKGQVQEHQTNRDASDVNNTLMFHYYFNVRLWYKVWLDNITFC